MPDGDRFQWYLKGKGWRKLYSLFNSGASTHILGEAAGAAIANYLRENGDVPFSDFIDSVQSRMSRPPLFELIGVHGFGDSAQLGRELELKAGMCSFAEPALLAQRAALKTYVEMRHKAPIPERLEIASVFAGKLGCEIVERKCLAIVRDEVSRQANRTLDDQVTFERSVMAGVEQIAQKFGPAMCKQSGTQGIRSPRRTTVESTETLLSRALPISTEAR